MEPIRVMADRSAEPIVGWDMTRMTRMTPSCKENGDRHQQRMHCFTPQMHKIEMLMAIPRRFLPNKDRDSCWRKTDDSRPSGLRSLQTAAGKKENRQFGPGRMCCFDIGEGWEEKDGYRSSARDCHQRCMQTIDSSIISAPLKWFSMRCRYEPLQAPFYETNVTEKSSTLDHQRVQFCRRGRPWRGQGLGMTPMLSAQGLAQGFWWVSHQLVTIDHQQTQTFVERSHQYLPIFELEPGRRTRGATELISRCTTGRLEIPQR